MFVVLSSDLTSNLGLLVQHVFIQYISSHLIFQGLSGSISLMCCLVSADFSNVISKSEVKALAEADEQEVVAEMQVGSFESLLLYHMCKNFPSEQC